MTKYEEIPLGSQILPGDRVTKVFEVMQGLRISSADCATITKIERPIPEVELPTAPGYYEAAGLPLSWGYAPYELRSNGQWYGNSCKVTKERMREIMPLTRLVPETTPARLADRIDLDRMGRRLQRLGHGDHGWKDDAASLIAAIDNGELDK